MNKIWIRVPATTANLGPGFDMLGMALSLYNEFSFEKEKTGLSITGCESSFATEENLAIVAFDATLAMAGKKREGLRLHIVSQIPVSRGLGSSASLYIAGAVAANALYDLGYSKEELLGICTKLEGHPDNLAAAFYGGLTASIVGTKDPVTLHYPVHPSLQFLSLIPPTPFSTEEARAALPKEVPFGDAAFTLSRLPLLLRGLEEGNSALLTMVGDKLHEPYREKLIPNYGIVKEIVKKVGVLGCFVSGAGSACFCVSQEDFSQQIGAELKQRQILWEVLPVQVDTTGIQSKEE